MIYRDWIAAGTVPSCLTRRPSPCGECERLSAENEKLRGLLHEARENVDLDVRELEAVYHGYPEIMERKTAADRDLRDRIDAALAAGGK